MGDLSIGKPGEEFATAFASEMSEIRRMRDEDSEMRRRRSRLSGSPSGPTFRTSQSVYATIDVSEARACPNCRASGNLGVEA